MLVLAKINVLLTCSQRPSCIPTSRSRERTLGTRLLSREDQGRLPFARKIWLEWNACNATGFSWLKLNRNAGPRWTLPAVLLTIFHPRQVIFGRSMLQKRTSWLWKLVIYSPLRSWFRNSEVLCKIPSHTVYYHAAEATILKNLRWKAGKGAEVNEAEQEFTNGTAIFRSFRLERERGIRLKISIPVERAVVPFEFPIGNFCFSKIQLVVYHQCCVLIGWATSRLYVIAH